MHIRLQTPSATGLERPATNSVYKAQHKHIPSRFCKAIIVINQVSFNKAQANKTATCCKPRQATDPGFPLPVPSLCNAPTQDTRATSHRRTDLPELINALWRLFFFPETQGDTVLDGMSGYHSPAVINQDKLPGFSLLRNEDAIFMPTWRGYRIEERAIGSMHKPFLVI